MRLGEKIRTRMHAARIAVLGEEKDLETQLEAKREKAARKIALMDQHAQLADYVNRMEETFRGVTTNLEAVLAVDPIGRASANLRGFQVPGLEVGHELAAFAALKVRKDELLAEVRRDTIETASRQLADFQAQNKEILRECGLL